MNAATEGLQEGRWILHMLLWFTEFKCDDSSSVGVNVDSFGKIFEMYRAKDSLSLRWEKTVSAHYVNGNSFKAMAINR